MPKPAPSFSLPPSPESNGTWFQRWRWWIVGGIGMLLIIVVAGSYLWYQAMLQPASTEKQGQLIEVVSGDTSVSVGRTLQQKHLIKSELAFVIYMRLHGGELRIGTYRISPSSTTPSIADHLISGKQDTYKITFFPGATLYSPASVAAEKRTDVYAVLQRVGFSDQEIKDALAAHYQSPLFSDKPSGASLEGYVYGETYQFDVGTSAKDILQRTFDTFWQDMGTDNIPDRVKARGLTLYQGITLASIIEREASSPDDQRQIAQVFYSRLAQNMPLGSDVTFIYAANQMGLVPSPALDSPYNTRIHTGLPPGPIAAPSISALEAVANPAPGDYLYFLAGDDGKIYYARTAAEHQQNITNYCHKLCS